MIWDNPKMLGVRETQLLSDFSGLGKKQYDMAVFLNLGNYKFKSKHFELAKHWETLEYGVPWLIVYRQIKNFELDELCPEQYLKLVHYLD